MQLPDGVRVGGVYVSYGMCNEKRNHHYSTPERDDDNKPIPMLYTLRRTTPMVKGAPSAWCEMLPTNTSFNTRWDFGCTNHEAR